MRHPRPLLAALLLGLAAGCAHRPDPASPLAPAPPAAARETDFVLTLLPPRYDFQGPAFVPVATPAPRRVFRGQTVFILPASPGPDPAAALHLELEIREPGLFSPARRASVPADAFASFRTTDRDPLGDYTVTLRSTDPASRATKTSRHTLRVEDYRPPTLPADFDPPTWLTRYHLQPTPELALPALPRLHLGLPADKRTGALPPLLGFYDQLLRDNPWLLPAFSARLAEAHPDEAYLLSVVLGFHFRRAPDARPATLDASTWTRIADFRAYDWPADPDSPLAEIAQLDALWGRFFATGRYTDLRPLLAPLFHHADLGAAERWQTRSRSVAPGADLEDALASAPPEVRRDLLLRSALWSLRSNARQHPLVRTYLQHTLVYGELPAPVQDLLKRILQPEPAD